nr:hypothetical protein BaRGS_026380 [Batillaria attramentaria]
MHSTETTLGDVLTDTVTKETLIRQDSALATTLAREKIEQRFSQHLKIYTDGSVLDSGEAGCAFVIPGLESQDATNSTPG